jgi:hypothetical protein
MTIERRLRLMKASEEERQVSPSVQERALRYYTPEQLAELAKKREEVKHRWTLTPPASAPRVVEVKRPQSEPLEVETDVTICPTCKLPIRDDTKLRSVIESS